MNIGIIFDAPNNSGGGFFQSLSSAIILNKIKDPKFNFFYIVFSDEVEKTLLSKGLKTINFKNNLLFSIYKKINNISFFSKILNKLKYKNLFYKLLKKNKINFVVFLGPSTLVNFLEDINFSYSIYDVQHKTHTFFPEYRLGNYFSERDNLLQKSIDKSFKIFVDTDTTKKDVTFYYNCKPDKIIVQPFIPFLPKLFDEKKNYELNPEIKNKINLKNGQKYLFYPAQFWAHKNHRYIADFLKLMKNNNNKSYKIVCCGSNRSNRSYVEKIIKENNLTEDFIIFNYLSNDEVIQLYQNSFGLIMPTYVARSTLPLYESFFFHKPVFYSNDILDNKLYQFVIGFNSNDPSDLVNKFKNIENGEIDLKKLTNSAFEYYKSTCNDEIFINNYKKMIDEYSYLRNRWEG
ncbi:glycosyltransferase [Candidatus Pelagibacter sp. Uisw_092]|uniref:glycosyltransferase n=1 Tax=Candidatus Pelagibacter sp. Uisw_092 TaxID=3230979 RepID=UPI0039E91116